MLGRSPREVDFAMIPRQRGRGATQGGQSWCILTKPSAANSPLEVADDVDETALATVMRTVPLGAAVLAGSAVALLVLGYLLVYILVFLPRGTVG